MALICTVVFGLVFNDNWRRISAKVKHSKARGLRDQSRQSIKGQVR